MGLFTDTLDPRYKTAEFLAGYEYAIQRDRTNRFALVDAVVLHALTEALTDWVEDGLPERTPVADPLDGSDHRDRIDGEGDRWSYDPECCTWRCGADDFYGTEELSEIDESYGPLEFAPEPQEAAGTPAEQPRQQGDSTPVTLPEGWSLKHGNDLVWEEETNGARVGVVVHDHRSWYAMSALSGEWYVCATKQEAVDLLLAKNTRP